MQSESQRNSVEPNSDSSHDEQMVDSIDQTNPVLTGIHTFQLQPREFEFVNQTPAIFTPSPSIPPPDTERRKVGRPRGSTKKPPSSPTDGAVYGPKRRRGRPPGSGKRKRLGDDEGEGSDPETSQPPPPKRGPGRPRKNNAMRVRVTQLDGPICQKGWVSASAQRIAAETATRVDETSNRPVNAGTPQLQCSSPNPPRDGDAGVRPAMPSITPSRIPIHSPHHPPYSCNNASPIHLLPGEDPQSTITPNQDLGDDDEGDEASSDPADLCLEEQAGGLGIGVDEEPIRGEEDVVDPSEAVVEDLPRAPLQPWLLDKVNHCFTKLQDRNEQGVPRQYFQGHTFWYDDPSSALLLQFCHPSPILLYNPRIFVWDPLALTPIPCPFCKQPLIRHGNIPRPRRVVDIDSTFWMVGYRYRCTNCRHPTSRLRTITFQSWDSRILQLLPPFLAAEFPARFSSRSGMSVTLFNWMRSCFQSGMGAKQFTDCVVVMHLLRYDKLRVQYYHALCQWLIAKHVGIRFPPFLPYDDTSPSGYHGYVPCATWFRAMYDQFIEEHAPHIFQHTAMLPLNIGALDHSHKITKHISRVNGERVFAGLLTVTNENGEIRASHLVTTTGHSQSELSLSNLSQSLTMYGHNQPQVMYTDNVQGDKRLLETVFKSLTKNVVAVEEYAHLEELSIPAHVIVSIENTVTAINTVCQAIMDDLPQDGESTLVIGLDSEWNVEVLANDRLQHRGSTAILQIAYKDAIYIFQISDMLAGHRLPSQLKVLLANPKILKAGRLVDGDLKNLQAACHSTVPFVGGVDLAKLAKQRCVLDNIRTTSLADLCARVLHKRLNKNTSERISSAWGDRILTPEQIKYASLDAYASLQIYERLMTLSVPMLLERLPAPAQLSNLPVMLYSRDKRSFIASGVVISPSPIVDAPPDTTSVEVFKVIQPGAKVSVMGYQMSLADIGNPPFFLLHPTSHLVSYTPLPYPPDPPHSSSASNLQQQPLIQPDCTVTDELNLEPSAAHISDPASAAEGVQILGDIPTVWPTVVRSRVVKDVFHMMNMFNLSIRHGLHTEFKRALRDAVLLLDKEDASRIITWGQSQKPAISLDELRKFRPKWLWRRCKRFIPPPEILYPRVYKVLQTFGPLTDATSGLPLFNSACWKIAKNVLDLVYRGELSDPGDVPLYSAVGLDKTTGLPLYRCLRGTNMTEGGVHTHLRPHLPTSGSSIRHVDASLLDFTLHHNLIVGTRNTTGKRYRGHYSIWITNEIQELTIFLKDILYQPDSAIASSSPPWVNGNFYEQTSEVPIGVLPVPKTIRDVNGLAPYDPLLDKSRPHSFLAKLQGTRKAILPVHTPVERALFRKLMQRRSRNLNTGNNSEFDSDGTNSTSDPTGNQPQPTKSRLDNSSWAQMVKTWNELADINDQIFYKLSEQLQQYFSHWKNTINMKETLALTSQARHPLLEQLTDLRILSNAPPVPQQPLQPHTVPLGLLHPSSMPPAPSSSLNTSEPSESAMQPMPASVTAAPPTDANITSQRQPNPSRQQPLLTQFQVTTTRSSPTQAQAGNTNPARAGTNERWDISHVHSIAQNQILAAQEARAVVPKAAKIRHCMKCGSEKCPGRGNRKYCKGVCQDCGSPSCRGRNSKRPDKICSEGWL